MAGELQTFFLAMIPFSELRVSIPVALTLYQLNWFQAYLISVIGNLMPAFFVLLFLEEISTRLSQRFKLFQRFFSWLFCHFQKKHQKTIEKYGAVSLFIFVALPLPMSGAWTGAIVSFLFGFPLKKALPLMAVSLAVAGLIVLSLSQIGILLFK